MSIFMNYEGIQGESSDKNHRNWIDVDDLHWGVKRNIRSHASTRKDRESANAEVTDLTLTRRVDAATPNLFIEACCGKGKTLRLCLTKTGRGSGSDVFMEYTMYNALLSHYDVEACCQSDIRPTEQITISFTDLEVRYTPYDDDGNPLAPIAVEFDTSTNANQ